MKRILALHGVGSSATILRDQLAPLANTLGEGYQFVYLDGAIERPRGPGMAEYYPGPFYSYTTGYSPAEVGDALDDLSDFIEDNGPFVGIIGFSQGASMAASYILDHQQRLPDQPPPFEFAVLLSSVAAFSPDPMCYLPVVQRLLRQENASLQASPDEISKKIKTSDGVFLNYLTTTFTIAQKIGAVLPGYDISFFRHRDSRKIPRVMHPAFTTDRIKIPTVHFMGKMDHPSILEQSKMVAGLCDASIMRVQQHGGGHGAPSKKADVDRLADCFEWAAGEGASRSMLNVALGRLPTRGAL